MARTKYASRWLYCVIILANISRSKSEGITHKTGKKLGTPLCSSAYTAVSTVKLRLEAKSRLATLATRSAGCAPGGVKKGLKCVAPGPYRCPCASARLESRPAARSRRLISSKFRGLRLEEAHGPARGHRAVGASVPAPGRCSRCLCAHIFPGRKF